MSIDPVPVRDWLLDQALLATPVDRLLEGSAERIVGIGIPLLRGHITATTLHPQFASVGYTWHRDPGIEEAERYQHDTQDLQGWQTSPLLPIARGEVLGVRHRLDERADVQTYPVLDEFRAMGGTDYIALGSIFGVGGVPPSAVKSGMITSWVTDRPGGFTDDDMAALKRIQPALAAATRTALNMEIADTVMATYLGPDAGARVLDGEVRRGHMQVIGSAILFADLRGFTTLSDTMDRSALVAMLNDYLAAMADPVDAQGGQVLKFLGDGMLAIFELETDDAGSACARALTAAGEALDATTTLNAERAAAGRPVMSLDIALHLGDVLYGNVGSERRLDFTVIGPAVNAASRIEALCGELDCPLLISGAFVKAAGAHSGFRSLGNHALRGIREPEELFTADVTTPGGVRSMRY